MYQFIISTHITSVFKTSVEVPQDELIANGDYYRTATVLIAGNLNMIV